jgi:hypothetical protein
MHNDGRWMGRGVGVMSRARMRAGASVPGEGRWLLRNRRDGRGAVGHGWING